MTFESLTKLINGTLLNQPSVKSFKNIKFCASRVKNGDIFIDNSFESIDLAIKNGAFGILSEKYLDINDNEIAWIYVDSIHDALIRILRFLLLEKNIKFFYFDSIKYQLLSSVNKSNNIYFLTDDTVNNFKKIIQAKENTLFISDQKAFLEKIDPNFQEITEIHTNQKINPTEQKPFISSFIYQSTYFKNIKISPLFLYDLEVVLNFLDQNSLSYNIHHCNYIEHFKPFFVDKNLHPKQFGTSEFILIFEKKVELIVQEYTFLKNIAKWTKTILFVHKNFKNKIDIQENIYYYDHIDEIFHLKNIDFNFAIISSDCEEVFDLVKQHNQAKQNLLFKEL